MQYYRLFVRLCIFHELKNERIKKGFDKLAPVYASLSRIVFGKTLERAQLHFLEVIKPEDNVLILGGGTGDFLKNLLQRHPALTVDYIDISSKMIQLARDKTQNPSSINFIVGTEENIPNRKYSVSITNFYLDLFSDSTLQNITQKIKMQSAPDAHWLVTDFVSQKVWHKIMLWMMYRFFRITTGIEARQLPDWPSALLKTGMQEIESKKFYNGFVKSSIYKFVTPLQG